MASHDTIATIEGNVGYGNPSVQQGVKPITSSNSPLLFTDQRRGSLLAMLFRQKPKVSSSPIIKGYSISRVREEKREKRQQQTKRPLRGTTLIIGAEVNMGRP